MTARCSRGRGRVFGAPSPIWTPASLPSLAAWYEAVDDGVVLERATQPTIVDGEFDSDTFWSKQTGWAIPAGGKAVFTAGAVGQLLYKSGVGIVGNRYTMDWYLSSGICRPYLFGTIGAGAQTVSGMYSEEETALTTAIGLQSDTGNGAVDYIRNVNNLSRTRWNPKAGSLGGYLAQATPAAQPWWDGTGVRFAIDLLQSSLAASNFAFLHNGTGCTIAIAFNPDDYSTIRTLFASASANLSNVGVNAYLGAGGGADRITFEVYNGSGTAAFSGLANGVINLGVKNKLVARVSSAGGVDVRLNGTSVISGSLTSPSAAAPTQTFGVGATAGGSSVSYNGNVSSLVLCNAALTDAEVLLLEATL